MKVVLRQCGCVAISSHHKNYFQNHGHHSNRKQKTKHRGVSMSHDLFQKGTAAWLDPGHVAFVSMVAISHVCPSSNSACNWPGPHMQWPTSNMKSSTFAWGRDHGQAKSSQLTLAEHWCIDTVFIIIYYYSIISYLFYLIFFSIHHYFAIQVQCHMASKKGRSNSSQGILAHLALHDGSRSCPGLSHVDTWANVKSVQFESPLFHQFLLNCQCPGLVLQDQNQAAADSGGKTASTDPNVK